MLKLAAPLQQNASAKPLVVNVFWFTFFQKDGKSETEVLPWKRKKAAEENAIGNMFYLPQSTQPSGNSNISNIDQVQAGIQVAGQPAGRSEPATLVRATSQNCLGTHLHLQPGFSCKEIMGLHSTISSSLVATSSAPSLLTAQLNTVL